MSEVTIREVNLADSASIADLSVQLGHEVNEVEANERIARVLSDSEQKIFVAIYEDRVVGYVYMKASFEFLNGIQARVEGLVVDETIRGKGIGGKLMKRAEEWSKEKGSKTVKLNSNTKRVESHKFYEKIGYIKYKEQAIFKKELI